MDTISRWNLRQSVPWKRRPHPRPYLWVLILAWAQLHQGCHSYQVTRTDFSFEMWYLQRGVRVQTPEPAVYLLLPVLSLLICKTLGKLYNLGVPQLFHL